MPPKSKDVTLSESDLREVARYAAGQARRVLTLFEADRPGDERPRVAIGAAQTLADGGRRGKALRDAAWDALRAAKDAGDTAAGHAARAAMAAAGAAYLHPLAKATQVKHILGSAAHAARATERDAGDDPIVGAAAVAEAIRAASAELINVLRRYPAAPPGGGRVGELKRALDAALRASRER